MRNNTTTNKKHLLQQQQQKTNLSTITQDKVKVLGIGKQKRGTLSGGGVVELLNNHPKL